MENAILFCGTPIALDEERLIPQDPKQAKKVKVPTVDEQMPIQVNSNTVEVDEEKGTITRKASNGKVLSSRDLTPEENKKYSNKKIESGKSSKNANKKDTKKHGSSR